MTTTATLIDLITTCHARGVRLEADADRGVIRWEGHATPALLDTLRTHKTRLLAVLSRFQRMVEHDASHDRPSRPSVHWPFAAAPGYCQSCGHVLDDSRCVGRCDACEIAVELFWRVRGRRRWRS